MGFDGSTNSMVALSLLDDTEKILDEGMQCPDDDVPIVRDFLDVFPDDFLGLPPEREIDFFSIDDIFVYSRSELEHERHLGLV